MMKPLLAVALYLLGAMTVQATAILIVSMQYSAAHPVPHIHYEGGTEVGDLERLQEAFSWVGFRSGNDAHVVHAVVLKPAGVPATSEEWALVRRLECGAQFEGLGMNCG